jgi:hypothetical protein
MALPSVSIDELRIRYEGDLSAFPEGYVDQKLIDVVALVQQRMRSIEGRLVSGALLLENYNRVICDVVLRIIRNPQGLQSESESGYSYGLRPVVASGNLWLTQDDVDTLMGVSQGMFPQFGTIGIGVDAGWG